jgi:hypothetical protein
MNELEQLKRALSEIAELRAELERRWKNSSPTQLDTLSDLHRRETTTGPVEDPAVRESARETIEALTKLNVELRKSLNVRPGPEV